MNISPIRSVEAQQVLFHDSHRIVSPAATRNLVGSYFEEASRVLFGANRHTTDGRCEICPDLSLPGNRYIECKSIGRGRQGLIYAQRLVNDRRMVEALGCRLFYVFWIHNVEATAYTTVEDLHEALAGGLECVLVIPFEAIRAACRSITPRVMNWDLYT